ncbi:MAG: hypothetical protein ACREX9_10075 [Gammaproteobacteria bacterium]
MSKLNPFPGLRPFEADESHLFFGRETATNDLLQKLQVNRFIAVVGTSGSGKSSLVRAGMLPDIHGGFMTKAGSRWRVAVLRPGDSPIRALAQALAGAEVFGVPEGDGEMQSAITEAVLRRGALGLIDVARQAKLPADENLLVVVDQFEELFRLRYSNASASLRDEPAAFVKLLLESTRQDELSIYVVLTMRSEYLGDCTQFWDLPEAINAGQYLIPRLTRSQRQEAITGPVAVGGAGMAPRLIQRLLNDVGDSPDQLPILQHALMRTWDHWAATEGEDVAIDLDHYEAIGGMAEALSRHADEAFNELPDDTSKAIVERLFKCITRKGSDNREMRFPTRLGELCSAIGAEQAQIMAVADVYRREGRSFLMPPPEVRLTADSLIDIAHESLIRIWGRLRTWVDEEAQSIRIYRRLAETSALYKEGEAGLWRDPDLQIALRWRTLNGPNEAWAQRYHPGFADAIGFLDKSHAAARRRKLLIWAPVLLLPLAGIAFLGNKTISLERQKAFLGNKTISLEKQKKDLEVNQKVLEEELNDTVADLNESLPVKAPSVEPVSLPTETQVKPASPAPAEGAREAWGEVASQPDALPVAPNATPVEVEAEQTTSPVAEAASEVKATPIRVSEVKLVTCSEVRKLEPIGMGTEFRPGRVYVFAWLKVAKDEILLLKWYREGGEQSFASSQIKARNNAGNFYRNFVWKAISEPGSYEIRLYDRNKHLIARQAFKII